MINTTLVELSYLDTDVEIIIIQLVFLSSLFLSSVLSDIINKISVVILMGLNGSHFLISISIVRIHKVMSAKLPEYRPE